MNFRIMIVALCAASANPGVHAQADASMTCEQAAHTAESTYGLPAGLLSAIGKVESGRRDPLTGHLRPWPYTLNANGAGSYFPDLVSASTAVEFLQSRGVASIDVGCFQVNLLHHPHAFPTLLDAFMPDVNADYAARFLLDLRRRTGDWVQAVMAYHSATPALGQAYWAQVRASWGYAGQLLAAPSSIPVAVAMPSTSTAAVKIWAPSPAGSAPSFIHLGTGNTPMPVVTYYVKQNGDVATGS